LQGAGALDAPAASNCSTGSRRAGGARREQGGWVRQDVAGTSSGGHVDWCLLVHL